MPRALSSGARFLRSQWPMRAGRACVGAAPNFKDTPRRTAPVGLFWDVDESPAIQSEALGVIAESLGYVASGRGTPTALQAFGAGASGSSSDVLRAAGFDTPYDSSSSSSSSTPTASLAAAAQAWLDGQGRPATLILCTEAGDRVAPVIASARRSGAVVMLVCKDMPTDFSPVARDRALPAAAVRDLCADGAATVDEWLQWDVVEEHARSGDVDEADVALAKLRILDHGLKGDSFVLPQGALSKQHPGASFESLRLKPQELGERTYSDLVGLSAKGRRLRFHDSRRRRPRFGGPLPQAIASPGLDPIAAVKSLRDPGSEPAVRWGCEGLARTKALQPHAKPTKRNELARVRKPIQIRSPYEEGTPGATFGKTEGGLSAVYANFTKLGPARGSRSNKKRTKRGGAHVS